jgi:UDP-4-amino-4,6-dideoxy-N-acetyl-beta-L-altrosamine transaminase
MIPYGKQSINQDDIDAVLDVLQSDFLTQGPKVPAFEQVVAHYVGAEYGVAVNSATSALHIACLALELGEGDVLWTSPNTFVASANCALYCGASVDFVDIDPRTYNLCPDALERKLRHAHQVNRLPKIVMPVHFAGQPCDMARIHALSLEYGFRIIEDASHAIGARYAGQPVGSGRYSDISVFSFHPVKIITSAEGGMAMTNQPTLAKRMQVLRNHGITRDPELMTTPPMGDWEYQQIALGANYRMSDIHAALGLSQLHRVDDFVAQRRRLQARYDRLLVDLPVITPHQASDSESTLHLYPIKLQLEQVSLTQAQVFNRLREQQLGVNIHYIPVHTQPYYQALGFTHGDYPHAEQYYKQAISLPLFHGMTEKEQDRVVDILSRILRTK